jgi:ATP-dependent Lon protease
MRESALAAKSYIRTRASDLGIDPGFADKLDLHIHVPAAAIPKDGPSAGITMAVALASALTGCKVRRDIAMTGEITLRGHVLPIGGLKEKLLAAHRAGVKEVLVPKENVRDLELVPEHVLAEMDIIAVEDMDEVLSRALIGECAPRLSARKAKALQPVGKPKAAAPKNAPKRTSKSKASPKSTVKPSGRTTDKK